jgi:hypothetical protein
MRATIFISAHLSPQCFIKCIGGVIGLVNKSSYARMIKKLTLLQFTSGLLTLTVEALRAVEEASLDDLQLQTNMDTVVECSAGSGQSNQILLYSSARYCFGK